MNNPFDLLLAWLDRRVEKAARTAAQRCGRRSFIAKLGGALLGYSLLPVLPFDRNFGLAHAEDTAATEEPAGDPNDPTACEYWRYCAIDGNLCNDCGGTLTSCPSGSEASTVSWVGTCRNPNDDKDYLVSYSDCCGKSQCTGTECVRSERERPAYQMGLHNDINWCMANASMGYHCTVAVLVGRLDG